MQSGGKQAQNGKNEDIKFFNEKAVERTVSPTYNWHPVFPKI